MTAKDDKNDELWEDPTEDDLVNYLLMTSKEQDCLLCQMTKGKECIWDEVGHLIAKQGFKQECISKRRGCQAKIAAKAARFACYCAYVFQISKWNRGMDQRIQNPKCVVEKIHKAFPDPQDNYVGYKAAK